MSFKSNGIILLCVLTFFLTACQKNYDQYAVLLWADPESSLPNDLLLGITNYSSVRDEYQTEYTLPESKEVKSLMVPSWRLELFDSKAEAESFITDNTIFKDSFGRSGKQALPVRQEQSSNSSIVYRLKENEEVKIIRRSEEKIAVGNLLDYWYEILTSTGTRGWVYGYQLKTDNDQEDEQIPPDQRLSEFNWRPSDFEAMIKNKEYDLDFFKANYGFFINPEDKTVILSLPDDEYHISYDSFVSQGRNVWRVGDSSLLIRRLENERISVEWSRKDKSFASMQFVNFSEDIQELSTQEANRRRALIDKIFQATQGLVQSDNFGTLSLDQNGKFQWQKYAALVPSVIPSNTSGNGQIFIRYYTGSRLSQSNDGILSFEFASTTGPVEINFLYKLSKDSLRLEYAPKSAFRGLRLIENRAGSAVIYFRITE